MRRSIGILLLSCTLLCNAAPVRASHESSVEFTDKIALVKDRSAANGTVDVAFEKHAAVYHLDRKLLRAAKSAESSGRPITVTVLADSMRIVKLSAAKRTSK